MHCQYCNRVTPTHRTVFYQNIGLLLMRYHSSIDANLCRECAGSQFWKMTLTTLFLGWWGITSFIVTPFILINNIARYIWICLSAGTRKNESRNSSTGQTPNKDSDDNLRFIYAVVSILKRVATLDHPLTAADRKVIRFVTERIQAQLDCVIDKNSITEVINEKEINEAVLRLALEHAISNEDFAKSIFIDVMRMCSADHQLSDNEYAWIQNFMEQTGLGPEFYSHAYARFFGIPAENNTESREDALSALGLSSQATESEIRDRYRELCKKHHPDRYPNESDEVRAEHGRKFKEATEAFEILESVKVSSQPVLYGRHHLRSELIAASPQQTVGCFFCETTLRLPKNINDLPTSRCNSCKSILLHRHDIAEHMLQIAGEREKPQASDQNNSERKATNNGPSVRPNIDQANTANKRDSKRGVYACLAIAAAVAFIIFVANTNTNTKRSLVDADSRVANNTKSPATTVTQKPVITLANHPTTIRLASQVSYHKKNLNTVLASFSRAKSELNTLNVQLAYAQRSIPNFVSEHERLVQRLPSLGSQIDVFEKQAKEMKVKLSSFIAEYPNFEATARDHAAKEKQDFIDEQEAKNQSAFKARDQLRKKLGAFPSDQAEFQRLGNKRREAEKNSRAKYDEQYDWALNTLQKEEKTLLVNVSNAESSMNNARTELAQAEQRLAQIPVLIAEAERKCEVLPAAIERARNRIYDVQSDVDEATQKVDFAEEELFKHKQNFTFGTVKLSAQSNPPA